MTKYPTTKAFFEQFGVSAATKFGIAKYQDTLINGDYCSLQDLDKIYRTQAAKSWLVVQLTALSKAIGLEDRTSAFQLDEIATMILTDYGWLKYTEFLLIFNYLRRIDYYGRFDISTIMQGIHKWNDNVRIASIMRNENILRQKQEEEWKRKAVLPPESVIRKMEILEKNIEQRKMSLMPKRKDEVKSAEMRKQLIEKYGKQSNA